MKTFGQLISEVAQPKAGDEKHFKAKHITTKKDHPSAPDTAFTGGTKKAPKRIADYDKGEDELVYEGSFDVPTAAGGEYDEEESHKRYKEGNKTRKMKSEAKTLDPVDQKELKKKFKDRSDKDIDNDGDVDSSDEYLHARRKAISKAMKNEEAEELDEVSKDLLGRYAAKAHDRGDMAARMSNHGKNKDMANIANKRYYGVKNAINKLSGRARVNATEEVELDENDDARIQSSLSAHKVKQDAKVKAGIPLRRPGESLAAYVTRKAKAQAKIQKEEVELDEVFKAGDKVHWEDPDSGKRLTGTIHMVKGSRKGVARVKADGTHGSVWDVHHSYLNKMDEEVEQLDELSPNTLHSYIKKAAGNMAGNAAVAAAQASSSMKKSSPDVKRNIRNRMRGITSASGRLADKANMSENAWEEVPMMMRQLQFIAYAAEEIMDYLDMGVDPEEWYQNKLASIHDQMQTLHAYMEGDKRMMSKMGYGMYGEETELDESITKMPHSRLKFHLNTNTPHGSYSNDEMKAERDRRLKTGEGEAYRAAKASLSEVTRSAIKKPVTYIDAEGKSRTRLVPLHKVDYDDHGQEKIKESFLDEAFKEGAMKLKDGSTVVVKSEDAKLLNQLMSSLNDKNRSKMESTLMSSKKGFNEILGFAREAL